MSALIKKTENKVQVSGVTNSKVDINQITLKVDLNITAGPHGKNSDAIPIQDKKAIKILKSIVDANAADTSVAALLENEYHDEINDARDLINAYKPQDALNNLLTLKKRVWNKTKDPVKFRILANIGACNLALGNSKEAANYFIEANQYETSEKSWSNLALGYLLLNETGKAIKAAKETIKINPVNETAYSVLIQAMGDKKPLEDVISEIPQVRRSLPQAMSAFGHVALRQSNYTEAIKWTKKALAGKKEKQIEVKLQLASILLESVLQGKSLAESTLSIDERKKKIEEANEVLYDAWNELKDTQLTDIKVQCLANLSITNRILGDIDNALVHLEGALALEPDNSRLLLQKASLLFENKDIPQAKQVLEKIVDREETATLLLVEILRIENNRPNAISILEKALKKNKHMDELLKREFTRFLIELYLQEGEQGKDKAKELADTLDANIPLNLVSQASVFMFSGKKDKALQVLKKASDLTKSKASSLELVSIANEYYQMKKYDKAAPLYARSADITIDNFPTRKLLDCYYMLQDNKKALDVLQSLRKKNGLIKDLTEFEAAIYDDIGDIPQAQKLCEEHLQRFPDDHSMKVRLAMLLCRQNKSVKNLLRQIDDSKLSLPKRIQLAHVYTLIDQSFESIRVLYEARRIYYDKNEAHAQYIAVFFNREKDLDLSATKVEINTAVCIAEAGGRRSWYLIEDRKDADLSRGELSVDAPLTKQLLNKKVGDEVLLSSNSYQTQKGTIVEILSKYVRAAHDSGEIFNKMFPHDNSFVAFSLDISDKTKMKKQITEMLDKDHERYKAITDVYKDGKITLFMLSKMLGKNVIDTWGYVVSNKELGITCSLGDINERKHVMELLNSDKPSAAIDLTALLTLHGVGLAGIVANSFKQLVVPQSTVDHLREVIAMRKGIESKGFMTFGKDNKSNNYTRAEITEEQIKKNIDFLESILGWINDFCKILPCKEALNVDPHRKEELFDMAGRSFIETALLAKQEDILFFSDDFWLRLYMKNEFGIESIWSQAVLLKIVSQGKLSVKDYEQTLIKLILSGYTYIPVSSDTLIESAQQASWQAKPPFTDIITRLSGSTADWKSSMRVTEDFAIKLYTRSIYLPHYKILLQHTINAAMPPYGERSRLIKVYLKN